MKGLFFFVDDFHDLLKNLHLSGESGAAHLPGSHRVSVCPGSR